MYYGYMHQSYIVYVGMMCVANTLNFSLHCSHFSAQEDPDTDSSDRLREECAQLSTCQKLYSAFEECEASVRRDNDEESCVSKLLDYNSCVFHCVSTCVQHDAEGYTMQLTCISAAW